MRRQLQIGLIYLVGLLQGIVMVMVPAAGALLTNGQYHDLSPSEYGALFIPMIFGAIGASLAAGNMAARRGLKAVFVWGLILNCICMFLFAGTNLLLRDHLIDYAVLLVSLLVLGMGFGSTLTMLNTLVVTFFPNHTATGMTAMHGLLGTGTALAPLLLNGFLDLKMWWGAPALVSVAFFIVIFVAMAIMDQVGGQVSPSRVTRKLPRIFWLFAAFTLLYGFCETVFGNWATIYLTWEKNISMKEAGIALAFFWGFVTLGRVGMSIASIWIAARRVFIVLPLMIAAAFLIIPQAVGVTANIAAYAFAGLACSACFPLSIGFGEQRFREVASVVSGRMTAAYMGGYGIAAYGVGVFHEWMSISLSTIYLFSAIPALMAWALVLYLWHRRTLA